MTAMVADREARAKAEEETAAREAEGGGSAFEISRRRTPSFAPRSRLPPPRTRGLRWRAEAPAAEMETAAASRAAEAEAKGRR